MLNDLLYWLLLNFINLLRLTRLIKVKDKKIKTRYKIVFHGSIHSVFWMIFFFNFIKKETLAQVFFWEFCEIFKNTYFYRTPPDDCFYQCFRFTLTHFVPPVSFYIPWKHQKMSGYLMFSGGIKKESQWHEMG